MPEDAPQPAEVTIVTRFHAGKDDRVEAAGVA
jgi:hypothetical protein